VSTASRRPGPSCPRGGRRHRTGRARPPLSSHLRGEHGGAPVPCGTGAPKELQHHLPALLLRRPSLSADPTGTLSGIRGSRLLDRRPPHSRCPAVPGRTNSARAIPMVRGSSVLPSTYRCSYCTRAGSRRLYRGTAHLLRCRVLRTATAGTATCWRPLITAGHPVRPSVPSPSCVCSGFGTPPPHRPAHCVYCSCFPAVRLCQALRSLLATRETITTSPPNVYSSDHRFNDVRSGGNVPEPVRTRSALSRWCWSDARGLRRGGGCAAPAGRK
jgi:hypothetical protein